MIMVDVKKKISELTISEGNCVIAYGNRKDAIAIMKYALSFGEKINNVEVTLPTDRPGMVGYIIHAVSKINPSDIRVLAKDVSTGVYQLIKLPEVSLVDSGMLNVKVVNLESHVDADILIGAIKDVDIYKDFVLTVSVGCGLGIVTGKQIGRAHV